MTPYEPTSGGGEVGDTGVVLQPEELHPLSDVGNKSFTQTLVRKFLLSSAVKNPGRTVGLGRPTVVGLEVMNPDFGSTQQPEKGEILRVQRYYGPPSGSSRKPDVVTPPPTSEKKVRLTTGHFVLHL